MEGVTRKAVALSRPYGKMGTPWRGHDYYLVQDDGHKEVVDAESVKGPGSIAEDTLPQHRKGVFQRSSKPLLLSISLGLLIVCSITFALFRYSSKRATGMTSIDHCGSTVKEARERGCVFEMTLNLWVPPACYDPELEEAYLQSPGLVFYHDINLTQEVPFDEVKRGESVGWFVPWQHHLRHCSFAFRKLHRAAASGNKLDGYVLQHAHTEHCLKMFTEPEEWRSTIPQFDMRMFPYCGKEGGYNVNSKHRFEWTD